MKAKLQKLIGTAVLGLALCSHSIPAWAGAVTIAPDVYVQPGYKAQGYLTGVRNSTDSTQYIGCGVSKSAGYGLYVLCVARDKTGRTGSCYSTDPRYIDAVKAMTDSSYLSFSLAASGGCDLEITNASRHLR